MSAVIGGIILTMFAIIVMLMCRKWQFQAKAGFSQEKTYQQAGAGSVTTSTATSSSKPTLSSVHTTTHTSGSSSLGQQGHTTATTSDHGSSTAGSDIKSGINGLGTALDWEQDSLDGSVTHPMHHANGPRIVNGLGDYGMVSMI